MRYRLEWMLVFFWILFSMPVHAAGAPSVPSASPVIPDTIPPAVREAITQNFTKSLPTLKIDSLEQTPITGLYQIISGPVVMYVTLDGHYAFSGDILNLKDGKTNLTEKTRQRALTQALEQFGEANMIVYAPPPSVPVRYTVTVFVDAECGYCQKFHSQIDKINQLGIKLRYIAFPKTGKNTIAYDTLVSIWCAPDRKKVFNQAMLGPIPSLKCQNHYVDQQFHLGAMAGVMATPTIVIDGKLMPGYLEPEALLALAQAHTAR